MCSHPQTPAGKWYSNIDVVFICSCSVICPEAATCRGSFNNNVFLKFLQNSQENTFVAVLFMKLRASEKNRERGFDSTLLKPLLAVSTCLYRLFDFENCSLNF